MCQRPGVEPSSSSDWRTVAISPFGARAFGDDHRPIQRDALSPGPTGEGSPRWRSMEGRSRHVVHLQAGDRRQLSPAGREVKRERRSPQTALPITVALTHQENCDPVPRSARLNR
jgi:hypothetical protein